MKKILMLPKEYDNFRAIALDIKLMFAYWGTEGGNVMVEADEAVLTRLGY